MGRPFFLVPLLALVASCAGAPSGPSRERIVLTNQPQESDVEPKQPPEWFDEQIANAEEEFLADKIYDALKRVYEARAQEPGPEHAAALRDLLGRLNREVLEIDTVAGEITAADDPIPFGQPLRVRVVVRNVGPRPVHIPARLDGTSRSMFLLEVTRTEYDLRSRIITTSDRVYRELDRDLDLDSGGSAELTLDLGPSGNDTSVDGFRVYTIRGVLRPVVLVAGGLQRWDQVPLATGTVRAFRANFEHLADDPLRRMTQAIEKQSGAHLLTAAALVATDDRRAAVDLLVDAYDGNRAIDWSIYGALRYLTRIDLPREPEIWRAWWVPVRDGYFEQGADRTGDPDVPTFSAPD